MNENGKNMAVRMGYIVAVTLAILTAIEYGIAVSFENSLVALAILAFIKAGVIINYFMHVGRTLNPHGEDH